MEPARKEQAMEQDAEQRDDEITEESETELSDETLDAVVGGLDDLQYRPGNHKPGTSP
jgi:hypothetical protein